MGDPLWCWRETAGWEGDCSGSNCEMQMLPDV